MAGAAAVMSPQPPTRARRHEPVLRSIRSGLALRAQAAGADGQLRHRPLGDDLRHAARAVPGALADRLPRRRRRDRAPLRRGRGRRDGRRADHRLAEHARYLGRIVLVAVAFWGPSSPLAGLVDAIWPALVLFALAGAADSVSAVCRSTISQTLTPDGMRGRVSRSSASSSPAGRGSATSNRARSPRSPRRGFSVVSGGLACLASVGVVPSRSRSSPPTTGTPRRRRARSLVFAPG